MIRTNAEHPFFVRGKGWLTAGELQPGDLLSSHDGQWVAVEEMYDAGDYETVYNLRVAEYHTYFVGSSEWGFSVWAHNAGYPTTDAERTQLADQLTQKGLIPTQSQRRMDRAKINKMVEDMQNNTFDWQASAREPIQLSPSREVYGGHHRLIAAEIAGIDILNMPGQSIQLAATSGVRTQYSWHAVLPNP